MKIGLLWLTSTSNAILHQQFHYGIIHILNLFINRLYLIIGPSVFLPASLFCLQDFNKFSIWYYLIIYRIFNKMWVLMQGSKEGANIYSTVKEAQF